MSKNILRFLASQAPAELPKQAASFDLPITLGVLAGSGQIASEKFDDFAVVGELSLEGRTRPIRAPGDSQPSIWLAVPRNGPCLRLCIAFGDCIKRLLRK